MLQGDINAPATFMRVMEDLMSDLLGRCVWVYIDDIMIYSDTEEEHLEHIRNVCGRLRKGRYYASRKKSHLFADRIEVLGHVINDEGIRAAPEKIAKIEDWDTPRTKTQLQRFLGMVNYISQFLPHHASITAPLTDLTGSAEFVWTATHDQAFANVKALIETNKVMKPISDNNTDPIWLVTDASEIGVGSWVGQGPSPETARPAALHSRKFTTAQMNYGTTDKEAVAIIDTLGTFAHVLLGREFTIITDHQLLSYVMKAKEPSRKQMRWKMEVGKYNTKIVYKPGATNYLADALSRIYEEQTSEEPSETESYELPIAYFSEPFLNMTSECPQIGGHTLCGENCFSPPSDDDSSIRAGNTWGDSVSLPNTPPEDRAHDDLHEIFCHVTDCPYHNQKPTIDYRTPPERYHTPIEEDGPSRPTRQVDPTLLHDHLMDSLECTSPHWGHCYEPYCPKHGHHAEGNET